MPKNSGPTNRNVVNHQNGKGDKSRITDVQAYRQNFDEIDWQRKPTFKEIIRLGQKFSEEALHTDEWQFRHGL